MPLPLPNIFDGDGQADAEALQFALQKIANALLDTGGRQIKIRFGTVNLVWTASTDAPQVPVTHGLGSAPIVVVATAGDAPSFAAIPALTANLGTSTTFQLAGRTTTAVTGSCKINWIAIG